MGTKRYKNSWTPEEDELLMDLVAAGKTYKEIKDHFPNRGISAIVYRKNYKLKLEFPKSRWPLYSRANPAHAAEIAKFKLAGWTLKDIEEVSGVHMSQLSCVLLRYGICLKGPYPKLATACRWTELENAILRKFLKREYARTAKQGKPFVLGRNFCVGILHHFPSRSYSALRQRAQRMVRYWPSHEELAQRKAFRLTFSKELRVY